jgi:hypothetical protein
VLNPYTNKVSFLVGYYEIQPQILKKIIITDNKDLIAQGVQAIDNEFLEWFVKNPSCERVEYVGDDCYYEIIIPQEEHKQESHICKYCDAETTQPDDECYAKPKQETLEDFIEEELEGYDEIDFSTYERFIKLGAKWQAERMYSEEDLKLILQLFVKDTRGNSPWVDADDEWFEQNKRR